ncbi:DUF4466 family protein [Sphingobacterium haloxyli]|uniref:DUF4466 domain-containing protein n=1 Tax=Sphingobacterium haloxyli TaxID=2100533 RepID=A0A2S9J5P7_9SPHI|nr:DUF4466 family protein [Sphingobacterium haloxyli]PRD48116.1 DUF4466 domain-containing protein [Sphingobacterium haloxyli]
MCTKYYKIFLLTFSFGLLFISCESDEYSVPKANTQLHNDVIKRTLGPNVVGLDIEFAYAMALGCERGHIVSAEVEASISGATGTFLEHRSFHTDNGGNDVGVVVGEPSITAENTTKVIFSVDTCAATLRYYYTIPEEARGKSVTFTFSSTASTGERVSYQMGPYQIAKMNIEKDIVLSNDDKCFFSIADMKVYDEAEALQRTDKIDLVYLYRAIPGIAFDHALVSPDVDATFLQGKTVPSSIDNATLIQRAFGLQDQHLARLQFGIYVDDLDFQTLNISDASNYAIDLRAEYGAWIQTVDNKYRAYVYVNAVNNGDETMTISIKRYEM